MNAFVVELEDRPGSFAEATEAVAGRGVNILIWGAGAGGRGVASFTADDEDAARVALDEAGIRYRQVPVLAVRMEDRPGQAAAVSRRLADAGVNLQLWQPLDTSKENFVVAIAVDRPEEARAALGDQVVG